MSVGASAVKWWELESPMRRGHTESPGTPMSAKSKKSLFSLSRHSKHTPSSGSCQRLADYRTESDQHSQRSAFAASECEATNPLEELFGGSLSSIPQKRQFKSPRGKASSESFDSHRDHLMPSTPSQRHDYSRYTPNPTAGGICSRDLTASGPGSVLDDERDLLAQSILQTTSNGSIDNSSMYTQSLRVRSGSPPVSVSEFGGISPVMERFDEETSEFGGVQIDSVEHDSIKSSETINKRSTRLPVSSCVFCYTDANDDGLSLRCKHRCHQACLHSFTTRAIRYSKLNSSSSEGPGGPFAFAKCGVCKDDSLPEESAEFAVLLELCAKELRAPVESHLESAGGSIGSIYDHYSAATFKSLSAALARSSKVATSASGLELFFSALPVLTRTSLDEANNYVGDSAHNFYSQSTTTCAPPQTSHSFSPVSASSSKSAFEKNEKLLASRMATGSPSSTELDCIIGVRAAEDPVYIHTPAEEQHLRQRISTVSTLQLNHRSVYCSDFGELRLELELSCSCDGQRWLTGRVFMFYSGLIICRQRHGELIPIMSINLDEQLKDVRIIKRGEHSALQLTLYDNRFLLFTGDQIRLQSVQAILSNPSLQLPVKSLESELRLNLQQPRIRASATICICLPTSILKSDSNHLVSSVMMLRSSVLSFGDKLAVVMTGKGVPPSLLPLMNARDPNWDARLRATVCQRMALASSSSSSIDSDGRCKDELKEALWAAEEVLSERDLNCVTNIILVSNNKEMDHVRIPAGLLSSGIQISTIAVMPSGSVGAHPLMSASATSGGHFTRIANLASVGNVVTEIAERLCNRTVASVEVTAECAQDVVIETLLAGDRAPNRSSFATTVADIRNDDQTMFTALSSQKEHAAESESLFDLAAALGSGEDDKNMDSIYLQNVCKFELMPTYSNLCSIPASKQISPYTPGVKDRSSKSAVVNLGSLAPGESASFVLRLKVAAEPNTMLKLRADYKQSEFAPFEQVCVELPFTKGSAASPELVQRIVIAEVVGVFELLVKHLQSNRIAAAIKLIRHTRSRLVHIEERSAFNRHPEFGVLMARLFEQLSNLLDRVQVVVGSDEPDGHSRPLASAEEALWILRSESVFELEKLKPLFN